MNGEPVGSAAQLRNLVTKDGRHIALLVQHDDARIFVPKYPEGSEANQAKEQLQKLQGFRVQLAAARDEKAAEKSRASLQARVGSELHSVVVVPPTGSEKSYRITSEPMTEDDAKSACTKLKKEHQHCEVVKS